MTFVLQIRIKKPPRIGRAKFTWFSNCGLGLREILLGEIHSIHCNNPIKVYPRSVVFNPIMHVSARDKIAYGGIKIIY